MLVRNVSITSDDFAINARLDNNMYAFRESDGAGRYPHETYWMHVCAKSVFSQLLSARARTASDLEE